MKEIKFRVWDEEKEKMYYLSNDRWGFGGNSEYSIVSWEDVFAEQYDELIPLQYTGLKDVTDEQKELWEHDIIEYQGMPYLIAWDEEKGQWIAKGIIHSDTQLLFWCIDQFNCYKLGNKYENPELLE